MRSDRFTDERVERLRLGAGSAPILAVALVIRRDVKGLAPCPGVNLGLNVCSGEQPAVHSLQTVSRGSLGSRALQAS